MVDFTMKITYLMTKLINNVVLCIIPILKQKNKYCNELSLITGIIRDDACNSEGSFQYLFFFCKNTQSPMLLINFFLAF